MLDFGEILRTVGDFGLFQKLILVSLTAPNLVLPVLFASLIFVQSDPDRRCNTDWILRKAPNLTTEEQLNLTLPREQDGTVSRCLMFVPVDWDINTIRERGLNETTGCQDGWLYDNTMYEATIVTDFDLICDKSNLVEVAQTVFMAGVLTGSFFFGPAAESCGRKRITQITVILLLIFTIITGLSPNLHVYMVSQFIAAAALGGYRINAPVLATEWIGVTHRSFASCLSQMFAAVGQCALAGLVYVVRDWRQAQYVMAGAQAFVCVYIWFIPESARWLFAQGRISEANNLVLRVAAINKRIVPENLLNAVTSEQKTQSGGLKPLFKSPILRKYFVITSIIWFSVTLCYFCLVLSVGKLGLDIFLVQLIFGVTEIPSHLVCIWFLEKLGRKMTLISSLLTGSVILFLTLALPQDSATAITALVTTGRFFVNIANSVCMVYVQELFPTSVRQAAFGLCSVGCRIAGLLAPSLNMLVVFHWAIPTVVFSSLSLVSGVLVFLLPETRRIELPDSTDEAEATRNTNTKNKTDSKMTEHNSIRSTKL
ncbi:solute carrier family 22 member 13-like [Lampris incognitus]|uniref:solute carrier family 22 member 13-like n=1 Tax=Lampris incognitus TaxID=2546036 RepID=UPI0024B6057B|nr:solute carrier family 22 member 13-like [Lampris incognitus]